MLYPDMTICHGSLFPLIVVNIICLYDVVLLLLGEELAASLSEKIFSDLRKEFTIIRPVIVFISEISYEEVSCLTSASSIEEVLGLLFDSSS